jgi:DNA-damage-inducible protein D
MMEQNNKIVLFQEKQVRRAWHDDQWYFSVIDIVEILTDSPKPKRYWTDIKRRSEKESGQGYAFCVPLKIEAKDGRNRLTDCANTEGVLRIIMSIPSPKAEPFKLWLAQVGKERMEEIENPEIGFERLKEIYKAKGYEDDWIEARLKSISIRKQLTDEWKGRGVKEGLEYSILSKATFGMTPSEYQKFKGLERQNLRDHMTNLELIFTMLGEESTKMTAKEKDALGFEENREAALDGGKATGKALKMYEKQSNRKVVTKDNFLKQIEDSEKKRQLKGKSSDETIF